MKTLKEYVRKGNKVVFQFYRKNELWYKVDDLFFPVPISDAGDGQFFAEDEAMYFMRYIRKHLIEIEKDQGGN